MKIKTFQGGFDKNFSYLIICRNSGYAAVIDPAVEPTLMIKLIKTKGFKLNKILVTHTHRDHIAFIKEWQDEFPSAVILGYTQTKLLKSKYCSAVPPEIPVIVIPLR